MKTIYQYISRFIRPAWFAHCAFSTWTIPLTRGKLHPSRDEDVLIPCQMTVISYVQDRCRAARHIQVLFIHLQSIYKAAISVVSLSFMLLFLMLFYTVRALEILWEITCHLSSTAAFSYGLRVCTGALTFTPISLGLYHLRWEYSWHWSSTSVRI